jgi:hypothetical protein
MAEDTKNTTIKLPPKVSSDEDNMARLIAITEGTREASGDVVSVACKVPSGMILQAHKRVMVPHRTTDGAIRDVPEYHPFGKEYMVYGPSHPQNMGPHCTIIGGYAITPGIPKELWDLWSQQHRGDMMVINRMIFAYSSNKIAGAAKEHGELKSGLERLDASRLPKSLVPSRDHMSAEAFNAVSAGK